MPTKRTFKAVLNSQEGSTATSITIPFDVEKVFGKRGRTPVRGTLNSVEFRSSVFRMRDEPYFMVINRALRAAAGVKAGDAVTVTMERDDEPRTVDVPDDLREALAEDSTAREVWEKLSYTHQKEYVQAITEAKRPETRARRIAKTIEALQARVK